MISPPRLVALPAAYRIWDNGRHGVAEGWTEWSETSFPLQWASKKTVYSPELAEIGNPAFFDRELSAFVGALRTGSPIVVPATQALNISTLIEALFASSAQAGSEVLL